MKKLLLFLLFLTLPAYSQLDDPFDFFSKGIITQIPFPNINPDTVAVGDYIAISNAGANLGVFTEFMPIGNIFRFEQSGYIVSFQMRWQGTATGVQIKIWTKEEGTGFFDSVAITENFYSQLTSGQINTVVLNTPVYAHEGDYYSIKITGSGGVNLTGPTMSAAYANLYYVGVNTGAQYGWYVNSTKLAGYYIPVIFKMKAPYALAIGNSIISGWDLHKSFYEQDTSFTAISKTIPYKVSQSLTWTYQNAGIGGQYSSSILARLTADVINKHPVFCIEEDGVNDINIGVSTNTIVANDSLILSSLIANGIIPVKIQVLPWTNGTNAQMLQRDSLKTRIANLCAVTFPKAIVVDCDKVVGQARIGGSPTPTPGNYWDIQTAYNGSGVHFNEAGYTAISAEIVRMIKTKYK